MHILLRLTFIVILFLPATLAIAQTPTRDCNPSALAVGDVVQITDSLDIAGLIVRAGTYLTIINEPNCLEGIRAVYDGRVFTFEDDGTLLLPVAYQTLEAGGLRISVPAAWTDSMTFSDHGWQGHIANDVPPQRLFDFGEFTLQIFPCEPLQTEYDGLCEEALAEDHLIIPPYRYESERARPITFEGGQGLRSVSHGYPFAPDSPYPDELYYGFAGVTDDYYIAALIPLDVDAELPTLDLTSATTQESITRINEAYFDAYADAINALAPEAFAPNLALLDAIMRSIEITEPIVVDEGD
jgi:hypothetical protein